MEALVIGRGCFGDTNISFNDLRGLQEPLRRLDKSLLISGAAVNATPVGLTFADAWR